MTVSVCSFTYTISALRAYALTRVRTSSVAEEHRINAKAVAHERCKWPEFMVRATASNMVKVQSKHSVTMLV
eukprot:21084-Heterococcus_DN1.PRE.3